MKLIPSYPDLPMEKVFPRQPTPDIPQVFLRTFWEILSPDHGELLANAVTWATNEPAPVTVEGVGVLDVTVWRQKASVTVHLVNLTNPMMMKGPVREVIPVGTQKVRVRLPDAARVRGVRLLVAGGSPVFRVNEGWLETTVPSVAEHEVVAVDL